MAITSINKTFWVNFYVITEKKGQLYTSGRITKQHVDNIVEYINMSLDNILGK